MRLVSWTCFLFVSLAAGVYAGFNEKQLRLSYGHVWDWTQFSPRVNISRQCREGAPLRVAYFTRHTGTLWDWIAVASHLRVPWTRVNPGLFQRYGLGAAAAAEQWRVLGHLLCRMADILVFSDTIPDARPLLAGNCATPIVLQVTNRFDYDVSEAELPAYLQLMAEAARRPRVWWVTNNPYEQLYMAKRGVVLPPERTLQLRPVGECLLHQPHMLPFNASTACAANATDAAAANTTTNGTADAAAAMAAAAAASARVALLIPAHSRHHLEVTLLTPWLLSHNLTAHVAVYQGGEYGGPAVLAAHRGVLTVPYQVSVMKMYEGLAAGAVFVLPSPTLFRALLSKLDNSQMYFCCRELLTERPSDWESYMDWYHPDFLPAHVMYDTMDELARFITDCEYSAALITARREVGRAALAASRNASLGGFSSLFARLTRAACAGPAAAEEDAEGLVKGLRRLLP